MNWFRTVEYCPVCDLAIERGESGYTVGAYMFNVIAAELVFAIVMGITIYVTWPNTPWSWITAGSIVLMIGLPVLFYPFSKTLFLGFDLYFHPTDDAPPPR